MQQSPGLPPFCRDDGKIGRSLVDFDKLSRRTESTGAGMGASLAEIAARLMLHQDVAGSRGGGRDHDLMGCIALGPTERSECAGRAAPAAVGQEARRAAGAREGLLGRCGSRCAPKASRL